MPNAFVEAILSGNLGQVAQHLQVGINLEELDEYGFTPLIEATIANQSDIVVTLLKAGAEVNNCDVTGRTALHWAVDNAHLPICKLLLQSKANPNAYTHAGQSVLVLPYLRGQNSIKKLLYRYKASLNLAQDFVQVKLLGHRYALVGQADVVDNSQQFIAVNYEGFFIEFAIEIVRYSLERYCRHFTARSFVEEMPRLNTIIQLFKNASLLLQYQKYTIDIAKVADEIDPLLDRELLLLPIAYEGHAISLIRYKDIVVRCDRGENSQREGSIVIYRMENPSGWTNTFVKQLLYQRQSWEFIVEGIKAVLALKPIGNIPMHAQLVGNCSWANIEASVLAILCLLSWKKEKNTTVFSPIAFDVNSALYHHWVEWDKKRALEECIQSFQYATPARKATIAMMLGAVLFQSLNPQNQDDRDTAQKIIPILMQPAYQYVLKSYLKVYWYDKRTEEGRDLRQLLDACGVLIKL